ncbi:kelch-like protein 42 isoform X2 [Phycodurus eques]|uniref:kelch-like protein 42 isoform X2 n=1 Tax=Phycodurus eques TaxID=693459 RepID=UPI002ACE4ED2|nr:kelch-like protein 42 isoform X2 [Phycodurus eques]
MGRTWPYLERSTPVRCKQCPVKPACSRRTLFDMSSEQKIAIVMEDKTYEVNKRKLIEKSDYFRALYSSGMRESTEDSVQLQGLSAPGLELVLEFIDTSKVEIANETLEDLIETASFLQVTSILKLLTAEIRMDNSVALYSLSEVYGTHELRDACLEFISCYYHPVMRRPEFRSLPPAVRERAREMRMRGVATLVATGDFGGLCLDAPDRNEPWSMLSYGEAEQRWKPLANNPPADAINVRGYGSAVLDNYLFIAGGYRASSQEISAAHCYNPCRNEWNQVQLQASGRAGEAVRRGRPESGHGGVLQPGERLLDLRVVHARPAGRVLGLRVPGHDLRPGRVHGKSAEHQPAALLPRGRRVDGVPPVHGARAEAADAVGGGHHLPGGRLHAQAGARPALAQRDGGRAHRAVVQRHHRRVAAAQGEHVQVGPEPDVRAAQRRHLHHEPGRRAVHQHGAPRLPQVQHFLRRLGGLQAPAGVRAEHAALLALPPQRALTGPERRGC